MWLVVLVGGLLAGVIAWELWICEGAHLGRGFVVWLYNLTADRYDRIKKFDPDWERRFLGEPLARAVAGLEGVLVLDVGAGTGRVARALVPLPHFHGSVIGAEPARRMLEQARRVAPGEHTRWLRAWSVPLPFADGTFDLVVSLEVLEFTARPLFSLAEMIRVLRPGGWLLVTNRVGRQAPWIVGRTFHRNEFPRVLEKLQMGDVQVRAWQVGYDLVWARKPAYV